MSSLKNVPELLVGLTVDLPTGNIAKLLSLGNNQVQNILCDVIKNIDIALPTDSAGILRDLQFGLIPVDAEKCNCNGNEKCCIAHKLYLGLKNNNCLNM